MSFLSAFNSKLIDFFKELSETFPEEREIRGALDAIQGARKINPRLILDLFYEHVARDLKDAIMEQNDAKIVAIAREKIQKQFNEIMPALAIFDKHWDTLSDGNKDVIWKWLKLLIVLCDKARGS
jgi:hypothetical protein